MVGDCSTTRIIATMCKELKSLLPLKRLLHLNEARGLETENKKFHLKQ